MPIIALIAEVNVNEGRVDEFLKLIEADGIGHRKHPGCLRFDVVQALDDPRKFIVYELYIDADAVAFHNEQQYQKDVVAFVVGGGATFAMKKAAGKFMTD